MTTPKLVITVIGDNEVGRGVGTALRAAGHRVLGEGNAVSQIAHLAECDLVVLALSGTTLTELISDFSERNLWRPGQLVAHTAGEFGYSVLDPAVVCGVIPLAIHPSMRFTDSGADEVAIRESYFAVSAPETALPIAQALVIEMGAEPLTVAEDDRATYFEAWSVANDFSGLVVNQAIGLLHQIGINDPRGVIGPVVRASVEQALADGHREIEDIEGLA